MYCATFSFGMESASDISLQSSSSAFLRYCSSEDNTFLPSCIRLCFRRYSVLIISTNVSQSYVRIASFVHLLPAFLFLYPHSFYLCNSCYQIFSLFLSNLSIGFPTISTTRQTPCPPHIINSSFSNIIPPVHRFCLFAPVLFYHLRIYQVSNFRREKFFRRFSNDWTDFFVKNAQVLLLQFVGRHIEVVVNSSKCKKALMIAFLHDSFLCQNQNTVGIADTGKSVCNGDRRTSLCKLL